MSTYKTYTIKSMYDLLNILNCLTNKKWLKDFVNTWIVYRTHFKRGYYDSNDIIVMIKETGVIKGTGKLGVELKQNCFLGDKNDCIEFLIENLY